MSEPDELAKATSIIHDFKAKTEGINARLKAVIEQEARFEEQLKAVQQERARLQAQLKRRTLRLTKVKEVVC